MRPAIDGITSMELNMNRFFGRNLLAWAPVRPRRRGLLFLSLLAVALLPHNARAQAETFSASVTNDQGSRFTLSIHKTGSRLSFSMTAVGGAQGLSGIPVCERADLQPDGTFSTYCGRFSTVGSSVRLSGSLAEARLDPIAHLGGATFKLVPAQ
jgi:hypothetical protein